VTVSVSPACPVDLGAVAASALTPRPALARFVSEYSA